MRHRRGAHLPVGVLVNVIIPRVVIVLNKSKIFFLFSLESGWSSVHIGRKVTLGEKRNKNKKFAWLVPDSPFRRGALKPDTGEQARVVRTEADVKHISELASKARTRAACAGPATPDSATARAPERSPQAG